MKKFFSLWLSITVIFIASIASAQPKVHSAWTASLKDSDLRAGEYGQIIFEATIDDDWYIYGPQIKGYWQSSGAQLAEGNTGAVKVSGDNIWPEGLLYKVADEEGNPEATDVVIYKHAVRFALPFQVNSDATGDQQIVVKLDTQACSSITGLCDPPLPVEFTIDLAVASGEARPEKSQPDVSTPEQPSGYEKPSPEESSASLDSRSAASDSDAPKTESQQNAELEKAKSQGIIPFFLFSMVTGLLALLTPCVWPMIPVTVSYFSKQSEQGGSKLGSALAYGLGIIFTFVGLGLLTAIIFGAVGPQVLAANVWVNLGLGILFVVLAANLFGYYEIMIPTKFVNKVQSKAKGAGWIAPVLLGFVFSLTSFTCTVPFVGTILVGATNGDYLYPIVGMLGFSLAFAVPFFLLALTPQALSKLPKSGTWMNTIKGFLGFVELAAAMKFFSNAELTFMLGFLTYPVYMAIWSIIFTLAALYLFGFIKIPNDEGGVVGIGRKVIGTAMVAFVGYLLAATNSPQLLGSGIAFTPPIPYPGTAQVSTSGLKWSHTFEEAMEQAKAENKPVFLNFTGVTCANCRVMENRFRNNKDYIENLKPFILAELYTDRGTEEDNAHGKKREEYTQSSSNPAYVIVKPDGTYVSSFLGLAQNDQDFINFLKEGYKVAQ